MNSQNEMVRIARYKINSSSTRRELDPLSPIIQEFLFSLVPILQKKRKSAGSISAIIASPPRCEHRKCTQIDFYMIHRQQTAYAALVKALPIFTSYYEATDIYPSLYPVCLSASNSKPPFNDYTMTNIRKQGVHFEESIWR